MNCPKCGVELKEESKFCPNCGEKLIKEETKKQTRVDLLREKFSVEQLRDEIVYLKKKRDTLLVLGIVSFSIAAFFLVLAIVGIAVSLSNKEVMAFSIMFSLGFTFLFIFVFLGVACFVVRSVVVERKILKRESIIREIEE